MSGIVFIVAQERMAEGVDNDTSRLFARTSDAERVRKPRAYVQTLSRRSKSVIIASVQPEMKVRGELASSSSI